MTNEKPIYENATITLPLGLKAEAKACGYNVSAVCATALEARIREHKSVVAACMNNKQEE